MFPSVSVTPFSKIVDPQRFMTTDPVDLYNSLGYYYSIGLFQQIEELQKLSEEVFEDIQSEFNAVSKRVSDIHNKVQDVKQRAKPILEKLTKTKPEVFVKTPYKKLSLTADVSSATFISMEPQNPLVLNLYKQANPPPTLEPWKPLIPEYQKLDKLISNPDAFMEMFRAEMLQDFDKLVKAPANKGERKKKEKQAATTKIDQALNVMIGKVLPLPQLVLQPPPVGQTKDWRKKIEFKTTIGGTAEESQFAASAIAPAVLSTPVHKPRSERPRPPPKPQAIPVQAPPPQQQPARSAAPAPAPAARAPAAPAPPPPPSNLPPPPAPPPPPSNLPPPPPPGAAAPAAPKAPKAPSAPPPAASSGASHLDLIKQGNFKLKKVQERAPEVEKKEEVDPNKLSTAELLQYMASIRATVKSDDSDDDEEDEDESSESW